MMPGNQLTGVKQQAMMQPTVLIIDDEPDILELLQSHHFDLCRTDM